MPDPYQPSGKNYDGRFNTEIGYLATEFEPFDLNPHYSWEGRMRPLPDKWGIVTPKRAPPIGDLPKIMQDLIKMTWKKAEPKSNEEQLAQKHPTPIGVTNNLFGSVTIGSRGNAMAYPNSRDYAKQIQPTKGLDISFPNQDAIASDWDHFRQIKRENAVTFRGDKRTPYEVIVKQKAFNPPDTRTDRYYLEKNLYPAFNTYINTRFKRPVALADFTAAVDAVAPTSDQKKLLVDYVMWRKIMKSEAPHLGRMVRNECLKGYTSTARAIDKAVDFATAGTQPGWLYLVIVHGGFVVPPQTMHWGVDESEIAQWGPVPAERIVGFAHFNLVGPMKLRIPDSQIFIRKSFRESERKAFELMLDYMSGRIPE